MREKGRRRRMSLFAIGPTLSTRLVTKRTIDRMAALAAYAASLKP
jgi:hypothetical protein